MSLVLQTVTQAPGKHVNARSAGWAFPRLLALKKHGPRNPTPPFRSFWGIRVKMQDLSFLSPLRGLPSLPGGSPISPYGGLPFTFGGLLLPLRSLPLRGVSHLHWGVSCLPLRGLPSPLGEICLPLGTSHLPLGGSPISPWGGFPSLLGGGLPSPLGVSYLPLGSLPLGGSPIPSWGVSHLPLLGSPIPLWGVSCLPLSLPWGGLPSPLEVSCLPLRGSPIPLWGGPPISRGGFLSALEGVYHPPLGRSPVSPWESPLGCPPSLLGCTALGSMILAHFCPLLPVCLLHSSGPA